MVDSLKAYERLALEDVHDRWELACGVPRRKPEMTSGHNHVIRMLGPRLSRQLDEELFLVDPGATRLRVSDDTLYIPDMCVIPCPVERRARRDLPVGLEIYDDPLPLVIEVWSPSTGTYDLNTKLAGYQQRGDLEIWRIHPYERTLTAWRRQPDGTYSETLHRSAVVEPVALRGVRIELAALFD